MDWHDRKLVAREVARQRLEGRQQSPARGTQLRSQETSFEIHASTASPSRWGAHSGKSPTRVDSTRRSPPRDMIRHSLNGCRECASDLHSHWDAKAHNRCGRCPNLAEWDCKYCGMLCNHCEIVHLKSRNTQFHRSLSLESLQHTTSQSSPRRPFVAESHHHSQHQSQHPGRAPSPFAHSPVGSVGGRRSSPTAFGSATDRRNACEYCLDRAGSLFCVTCDLLLCDGCAGLRKHTGHRVTRAPTATPHVPQYRTQHDDDEEPSLCDRCSRPVVEFYCSTCRSHLCEGCCELVHIGMAAFHDIEPRARRPPTRAPKVPYIPFTNTMYKGNVLGSAKALSQLPVPYADHTADAAIEALESAPRGERGGRQPMRDAAVQVDRGEGKAATPPSAKPPKKEAHPRNCSRCINNIATRYCHDCRRQFCFGCLCINHYEIGEGKAVEHSVESLRK